LAGGFLLCCPGAFLQHHACRALTFVIIALDYKQKQEERDAKENQEGETNH